MQFRLKPITYYLDGRLFEWVMALTTLGLGLEVLVWPSMLKASSFQWMAYVGFGEMWGLWFCILGFAALGALIANGASFVIGPRVRSICAMLRSVIWVQFSMALVKVSIETGIASPGIPFWTICTVAEIYVTYRAVLDVRSTS